MAFKSPVVISSTCNCGGDTCKSLRCGRENQAIDRKAGKSLRKIDLGPVPSPVEVHAAVDAAVTAIQNFLQEKFSLESMSKWLQPLTNSYDSSVLDSRGYRLVCKGFQWLQTDPNFKDLVISLCSDEHFWDAVKNNGIMKTLQQSPFSEGGDGKPGSSKKGPDFGSIIISWILQISLSKIGELIENFGSLLNDAFRFPGKEKLKQEKRDEINEKIESSLVLSLVVLLIVVVARAQIA